MSSSAGILVHFFTKYVVNYGTIFAPSTTGTRKRGSLREKLSESTHHFLFCTPSCSHRSIVSFILTLERDNLSSPALLRKYVIPGLTRNFPVFSHVPLYCITVLGNGSGAWPLTHAGAPWMPSWSIFDTRVTRPYHQHSPAAPRRQSREYPSWSMTDDCFQSHLTQRSSPASFSIFFSLSDRC